MRPPWEENLSTYSLEEVVRAREENRAWYKQLRTSFNTLMDTKLAKQIGPEEYLAGRSLSNVEVAEYKRRGRILIDEIDSRTHQMRLLKS